MFGRFRATIFHTYRSLLSFGVNPALVQTQRNPNPKHVEEFIIKYAQHMANNNCRTKTDGLDTYFSVTNPM